MHYLLIRWMAAARFAVLTVSVMAVAKAEAVPFVLVEPKGKPVVDGREDERILQAILWGSEYRFWPNNTYETKFPAFLRNR